MNELAWSGVASLVCAAAVRAATNTWDGGSTSDSYWSSAANWSPDGAPVSASDTVLRFNGGTRLTPTQNIATPFVLNRLEFLGGASYTTAFTIGGSQLQFVSNNVAPYIYLDRNATCVITNAIDVPAGTTLCLQIGTYGVELRGPITGGGSIDKGEQSGGLSLYNSANKFSGGLIVRAQDNDWFKANIYASNAMGTGPVSLYGGTLATNKVNPGGLNLYNTATHTNPISLFATSPIFAAMPNGTANVTLNGNIDLNTYTLHLRGGGAGTIGGVISEGASSALAKSDSGTWTLNAANTFQGQATLINGTLKLGAAGSLASEVALAFSCATGWYSAGHATFDLNGRNQAVSQLSGSTTHAFLTNVLTSATAATLVVDQSATTVFNGRLTGALSLVKTGAGTLALSNYPSAATGNITVSNGTLAVASGANLGSCTNVAVAGGRLELYVASAIADAAALSVAGGAKVLLSGGATETVDKLFINGAQQPRGYYGTGASGAIYADDAHFEGAGMLYVVSNPPITPTSVTWDSGGADLRLSSPANWVGDATPAFDGTNRATFATGGLTASVDVAANLYGIAFNRAGAFTLAAGAGVISNGAGGIAATPPTTTARTYAIAEDVLLTDHQTWNVVTNPGVASLNMTGVIDDGFLPCNITKTGFGPLGLTGSSTFDGTLTVNEGDVSIYNSQALGSTNGNTVINGTTGGRLYLNGNLVVSEPLVLNGEKNNGGTLMVGTGSNVLTGPLTCYNPVRIQAYNGPLVIAGGVTADNNGLFVVNSGSIITFKDKPLNLGLRTFWSDSSGISVLAVSGNTWADTVCAGGGIRCQVANAMPTTAALGLGVGIYGPGGTFNLNGYDQTVAKLYVGASIPGLRIVTSDAPALLTVNQNVDSLFDGRFTGAVSLLKTGTGRLTLTNALTSTTGSFSVTNGILAIARDGTFGPNCTNVVVSGTGTLVLSNSVSIANTATVRIADGGAKLNLAAGVNETVGYLILGDTFMRAGTYGSSNSGAGHMDNAHFSGSGMLTVLYGTPRGTTLLLGPSINTNNWPSPFVTNTVPFAESFEALSAGIPVSSTSGWRVEDGDASRVMTQPYDYSGTRPLSTTHTNLLQLETEGQTLGTLLATNATTRTSHLWVDMMARINPSEDIPSFDLTNGPAAAVFTDFNRNLTLYAASLDSSGILVAGNFNLTPSYALSPTDWHRITFDLMSNADGSNDFFRVFLDGIVLTNAAARVSPVNLETNGTWFCLTRHEANLVPSLGFQGTGMVDDLVVTPDRVFETVLYLLTVNGGTGGGAYTNGQQVKVAANQPVAGYEFDRWTGETQYVESLTSATTTVTMPALDITLAATYKASPYTVNFDPQDGSTPNPVAKTVQYGSTYGELAVTTRHGFSFGGWYFDADCAGMEVTSASLVAVTNNHTLYAKWILRTTTTTPVHVPLLWLDQFPDLLGRAGGNYEVAAFSDPDLDGMATWQEYVAGSCPTDSASYFKSIISISNDLPWLSWTPDLGTTRVYSVFGKTNLTDTSWGTTNAANRFFRVEVTIPQL